MNEIELNWFKISKYLGEPTKVVRVDPTLLKRSNTF